MSGCKELIYDWGRPGSMQTFDWSVARSPGNGVRVAFERYYANLPSGYQAEVLVWDSDNGVAAAWRHDGDMKCLERVGDLAAGDLALTEALLATPTTTAEYRQVIGSPQQALGKTVPDYIFCDQDFGLAKCPSPLTLGRASANDKVAAMHYDEITHLVIRDRLANTVDALRVDGGPSVSWGNEFVVGDAVFWSDGQVIYVWRPNTGAVPLIAPPNNSVYEHDIATDGTYLAWVESRSPDNQGFFTVSVLFVSPFTTTASQVQTKAVAPWVCPTAFCDARMEDGWVAVKSWRDVPNAGASELLVRLSDGARWSLDMPKTDGWQHAFVMKGELWMPLLHGQSPAFMRLDLGSLGAPQTD